MSQSVVVIKLSRLEGGSMWIQAVAVVVVVLSSQLVFREHSLVAAFSFPGFSGYDPGILTANDSSYNPTLAAYEMTTHSSWEYGYCGLVLYKDKVRIVDKGSGQVASFNTSFTFQFQSVQDGVGPCRGEGMLFTFRAIPHITSEEYLYAMCTFDYNLMNRTDFNASNPVFAVKFSSSVSSYGSTFGYDEPSDGSIDVITWNKGKLSVFQYNLCGSGITQCRFFCGTGLYDQGDFSAWIDYDGVGQKLEVRFRNGSLESGGGKPAEAVITVPNLRLHDFLPYEEMYVGFTAKTYSALIETHRIKSWNFNSSGSTSLSASSSSPVPSPPGYLLPIGSVSPENKLKTGVIAGICTAGFGVVVMGVFVYLVFKHKRKSRTSTFALTDACRAFTFKELSSITKNFNGSELLSSGAFGDVFKGTPLSGNLVAVKRIKHNVENGAESFLAEANTLGQIRHRNLLKLRGWCQSKEGMFLVYDFMINGSLDKWLHPERNAAGEVDVGADVRGLSWNVRRFILAGVASGLEYLHEDWVHCVLHRDIKSSNVMIDGDFNAYLGDFGLARLVEHHKMHKTTMLAGTLGYMAPEMIHTGRATKESDVFAFGILVLEVVCGRRPLDMLEPEDYVLLDKVWRAREAGDISRVVDPRLEFRSDALILEMDVATTLHLGLLCCLPNPSERPSIREVNQWFQSGKMGGMELPPLPATNPVPNASMQYNYMLQSRLQCSELVHQSSDGNLSWQSSTSDRTCLFNSG